MYPEALAVDNGLTSSGAPSMVAGDASRASSGTSTVTGSTSQGAPLPQQEQHQQQGQGRNDNDMMDATSPIAGRRTPGVWSVSHSDLGKAHAEMQQEQQESPKVSRFELVTDVTFVWPYDASSAFLTGTFSNWEQTTPMTRVSSREGTYWTLSKALPPGDYQYKFIIDNVWSHAPDQPIVFDERGIINNILSVTVESCGDPTCFCSSLLSAPSANKPPQPNTKPDPGVMTPHTMQVFQRQIGVAYRYQEYNIQTGLQFRKSYMHKAISDRPFDVTVVNASNLPRFISQIPSNDPDGTISRASSYDDIAGNVPRYDPNVSVVNDAAYAAALNESNTSLPHTAQHRAVSLCSDPAELTHSVRARLSSPLWGFNPKECHEGITLTDTNHCAIRVQERGLYKTVRSVLPVRHGPHQTYFECFIHKQATGGGVCIGLSTQELPLSCLCGTRPNSVGFSTSGNIIKTVQGKEKWMEFGTELGSGCTVGCLVRLEKITTSSNKPAMKCEIEVWVDGKSRGTIDYEFLGQLDVYPTLSMFAKNAKVYSLFSANDMRFANCLPELNDQDIQCLDERKLVREKEHTPQTLELSKENTTQVF
eukprot:Plantae.Rhodophyta-Hildenbrandia_rubra.ctg24367.p1 GENE.Plantae.Rhodophyta-Hildenbrandia_rubra.ctg24367~~Plantae.Rhodophyta-Hildenbrandia_rubra.ctg24367.p1  ORF type:complete len:591 (-),score=76.24 Plantae.Rhodophyta-Hildenbrandia_rubra.ctg24367:1104-2876(-)